jgi:hypothetical protein
VQFGREGLVFGRHASVLPGKQELKQLCVCYPQVLAAILMGSPNRSIRKPRPRPTTPGQCKVQLPDHQAEFWMPRCSPADPVARLGARLPRARPAFLKLRRWVSNRPPAPHEQPLWKASINAVWKTRWP